jgi:hypothetical protein
MFKCLVPINLFFMAHYILSSNNFMHSYSVIVIVQLVFNVMNYRV